MPKAPWSSNLPIAEYSFMQSGLYDEYYDLYFNTSEQTIEDVASIWIDFQDTSIYRIPHKLEDSDYYFHLSSTYIDEGQIDYNFQVRDLVENIGKSEQTIIHEFFEEGQQLPSLVVQEAVFLPEQVCRLLQSLYPLEDDP